MFKDERTITEILHDKGLNTIQISMIYALLTIVSVILFLGFITLLASISPTFALFVVIFGVLTLLFSTWVNYEIDR